MKRAIEFRATYVNFVGETSPKKTNWQESKLIGLREGDCT